ncbi:tRNA (adenosine(37)-N6)-threonylcarbamoyltransferase complex transferase subunit TsaD [SAR86 cluster bacterium]|nr:tRNA (adenosine(37)-N6)-threonylcarbamoyltransferase complex transferase subunit TsaD [SAR86 cluster bacterium]
MNILGIETSCDETALAIYSEENGLVANSVHSQVDLFKEYGGVVPEIAARDHSLKIIPLLENLLNESGEKLKNINFISYTAGPGLIGSLLIGDTVAKTLSKLLDVGLIPINHLEGHILAPCMEYSELKPPYICLLVSGGHTQIIVCESFGTYKVIGETIDDACGEAFDKVGKLLGLEYPGGPKVSKLAENGDSKRFNFPRALKSEDNLDFSFSGLKTSVLYQLEELQVSDYPDVAASFQEAVIDILAFKLFKASKKTGIKKIICSGGVAANKNLRQVLKQIADEEGIEVFYPKFEYCTDNAAMIAYAGFIRKKYNLLIEKNIFPRPRWAVEEI